MTPGELYDRLVAEVRTCGFDWRVDIRSSNNNCFSVGAIGSRCSWTIHIGEINDLDNPDTYVRRLAASLNKVVAPLAAEPEQMVTPSVKEHVLSRAVCSPMIKGVSADSVAVDGVPVVPKNYCECCGGRLNDEYFCEACEEEFSKPGAENPAFKVPNSDILSSANHVTIQTNALKLTYKNGDVLYRVPCMDEKVYVGIHPNKYMFEMPVR